MPVALAPIGSIERFDPAACAAVANAAGTFGCAMFQSSVAKPDIEVTGKDVPSGLKIFQLYVRGDQAWVEAIFDRAVKAGFGALCLTVDTHHYSRRERDISKRYHAASVARSGRLAPSEGARLGAGRQVKKRYKLPLIIKGIATAEDAKLAVEHGVDVIYVSNHGGRQLDHGARRASTCCRRSSRRPRAKPRSSSTAASAAAPTWSRPSRSAPTLVCIGRLYAFGMAAAGRDGIFRVLELLQDEMIRAMGLLGVNRLDELNPSYLRAAPPVRPPHVLSAFPYIERPTTGIERQASHSCPGRASSASRSSRDPGSSFYLRDAGPLRRQLLGHARPGTVKRSHLTD